MYTHTHTGMSSIDTDSDHVLIFAQQPLLLCRIEYVD